MSNGYYPKSGVFKDLSRRAVGSQSTKTRRDMSLEKMLNAIGGYADMKVAKTEKAALNVVEALSRNSAQFNSQDQFDVAYKTLDSARVNVYDDVSQSLLDTYEVMLDKHLTNFDANIFIRDAMIDTQELLKGIDQGNRTTNINEINKIVETINGSYLENANAAVLTAFNKQQKDIQDAIYVTEMLDLWDWDPLDAAWNLEGRDIHLRLAAKNLLAGNMSKSRSYVDKAEISITNEIWDALGSNYQLGISNINNKRDRVMVDFKDSIDSKHAGLFKYLKKIPRPSLKMLNSISTRDQRDSWDMHLRTVLQDDDIVLSSSLQTAYTKRGLLGLYDAIRTEVAEANQVSILVEKTDEEGNFILDDVTMLPILVEKWVPEKVGNLIPLQFYEWLDANQTFRPHFKSTWSEQKGDNRAASELFWDWMSMYKMLEVGIQTGKDPFYNPNAETSLPPIPGLQ